MENFVLTKKPKYLEIYFLFLVATFFVPSKKSFPTLKSQRIFLCFLLKLDS